MNQMVDKPLFTTLFSPASLFSLDDRTVLIHGEHVEDRHGWSSHLPAQQLLRISDISVESFKVTDARGERTYMLRSAIGTANFWNEVTSIWDAAIIDLTSLPHSVWALLLRSGLKLEVHLRVCYAEPEGYQQQVEPSLEGEIFDLSEKIEGIRPLPGFASFSDDLEDDFVLVPLLGFEGTRFAYVVETTQPKGHKIIPVIGIPGFQPDFVFHTYYGNKPALLNTSSYTRVRFATANCPFSLAYVLEDIAREHETTLLKIALLGTKPHALGAFLFERRSNRKVEFIYDNPVRKPNRTSGVARLIMYDVCSFLNSGSLRL